MSSTISKDSMIKLQTLNSYHLRDSGLREKQFYTQTAIITSPYHSHLTLNFDAAYLPG